MYIVDLQTWISSIIEFIVQSSEIFFAFLGAVGGISDIIEVAGEVVPLRSYQNQTAEDIESGRARMDSVTSYGSGGSEDALLPPDVIISNTSSNRYI